MSLLQGLFPQSLRASEQGDLSLVSLAVLIPGCLCLGTLIPGDFGVTLHILVPFLCPCPALLHLLWPPHGCDIFPIPAGQLLANIPSPFPAKSKAQGIQVKLSQHRRESRDATQESSNIFQPGGSSVAFSELTLICGTSWCPQPRDGGIWDTCDSQAAPRAEGGGAGAAPSSRRGQRAEAGAGSIHLMPFNKT